MASEAEIERLYQLFVANGGGSLTFDGTNLTPKLYSEAIAASNLTPLQMAQLEARQQQYNRQAALNSIANEIDANNFTNPYAARGAYGNSLFNTLGSSSGVTSPIHGVTGLNSAFSGFGSAEKGDIFAGVLRETGIDLGKFLEILGLMALGNTMYTSLTNHTNNQTANIPQTMEDASSLSSMNEQFGEKGDPCSFFNQLMGILAGVYDGTLDFIDGAVGDISSLLNNSGITSLIQSIIAAIAGAGSIVVDVISAIIGVGIKALGGIISLVSPLINAIGDITSAIANEIAALANMAAQLISKALALLIGGAAADPCKKAVLMNTGSPAMKEAVIQLNQPAAGPPHIVGTIADERANAEEVKREMKYSRDEAKLEPGVPQSPLTEEANVYVPNDTESDSELDSESNYASLHTSIYPNWSNYKINGQYISSTAYKDYKKFLNNEMTVAEETKFRNNDFKIPKKDGSFIDLPITAAVLTDAKSEWIPKQKAYLQSSGTLAKDLWIKYACGIFESDEKRPLRNRFLELHTDLSRNRRVVEKLLSRNFNRNFRYQTKDGNIDQYSEDILKERWNKTVNPDLQRKYDLAIKNLNETKTAWENFPQVDNRPNCTGSAEGTSSDISDFT